MESAKIVFSLWSSMMGSTVLVMPQLFRFAGVIASIPATVVMAAICCYTAVLMVRNGKALGASVNEILDSLPKVFRWFSLVASILVFAGVCMLIHLYMADSIMRFLHKSMAEDTSWRVGVSIGIGGIVFLISLLRSLKPLFMASSYCVVLLVFCSVFILVKSSIQLTKPDCTNLSSVMTTTSFGVGWQGIGPVASLMAVMSVSFFCHNFVLQLLTQTADNGHIERNIVLAFICTALTYGIPSGLAVYAFRYCTHFRGDFVKMYDDIYSDVTGGAIILLVGVVYPVVVFIARTQVLQTLSANTGSVATAAAGEQKVLLNADDDILVNDEKVKSERADVFPYPQHIAFNFLYLTATTLPSCFNASLTVVSAAVGVFGTFWALCLPTIVHLRVSSPSPVSWILHGSILVLAVGLMAVTILSVVGVIPSQ